MVFSRGLARPRLKYSVVGIGSKKVSIVSTDPCNDNDDVFWYLIVSERKNEGKQKKKVNQEREHVGARR